MIEIIIIFVGRFLLLIQIIAFAFIYWFVCPKQERKSFTLVILLGGLGALIASYLAGQLYFDPRPAAVNNLKPLFLGDHIHDNGFPSSHALLSATLAALVFLISKKWGLIFFVCTIAIGSARVIGQVHHPIDIVGAIFIAIVMVAIANKIVEIILAKKQTKFET